MIYFSVRKSCGQKIPWFAKTANSLRFYIIKFRGWRSNLKFAGIKFCVRAIFKLLFICGLMGTVESHTDHHRYICFWFRVNKYLIICKNEFHFVFLFISFLLPIYWPLLRYLRVPKRHWWKVIYSHWSNASQIRGSGCISAILKKWKLATRVISRE